MAIAPATSSAAPVLEPDNIDHSEAPPTENKHVLAENARLRIHLDDVSHQTVSTLVSAVDLSTALRKAIDRVHEHLYKPYGVSQTVRSVTLIFRQQSGVAYTSGTPLDEQHKEIVFALDYLNGFKENPLRFRNEVTGVITHEMVHCFQHDCKGTAPWWLIEGIADFVRLKSGLAPPHWNKGSDEKTRGKSWDEGYQKTAWFLEFLERKVGPGTISRMNAVMRETKYVEDEFWPKLFNGRSVKQLWERYKLSWDDEADTNIVRTADERAMGEVTMDTLVYANRLETTVLDLHRAAREMDGMSIRETPTTQKGANTGRPVSTASSEAEIVNLSALEKAEAAGE